MITKESPTAVPAPAPRRILVIDDDRDARQFSVGVLVNAGYDVEAVQDGAAGWGILQASRFDLIITDNVMPKMTGLEMIEKLRAANITIPVLMATGLLPTQEFERKPWLKPDATLQRPFTHDDLLAAVKSVLPPDTGNEGSRETRTEPALRASELSYRRLFEAARDGIMILDVATGRITDVNPFLVELLGFSHAEMVGQTVGELSPFKDIQENKIMLERLQSDGYVRYDDLPLETRNGRHVAVEFVCNVYEAGDQQVIQCNIRDITERKQAEKVSIRLAAIVESSEDAIIGQDLEGIIQSWNTGAENLFGFSAGEMVGCSIVRLIPAERLEQETHLLEKIKRGESMRNFETVRQAKNGQLIEVSITVSPIKDSTGKVVGASRVARDITERKQHEAQLKASFKEISDLKSALDEHAIVANTDPQGKITSVNDKFCAISQYSREELLGQDHRLISSRHHSKEFIRGLWATIARGQVWKGEIKNLAKDGSFYWVDSTIVPFLNDHGKPRQYVAIRTDITRHKAAEEKILQLNAELEQRVSERTAQLLAANEELQAFSYSVSHDLRAPLRHVAGFVDLLLHDAGTSLSEKQLHHLTTISTAATRMGTLIDDLLAFSRIGQAELRKTVVNLDQLVRETLGDFQADTEQRKITWEIQPLPAVWADRALLRLVLVNLISNAVKFTSKRAQARIEIGCRVSGVECQVSGNENLTPRTPHLTPSADTPVFFIRDNGAGFDPLYAGKLFGVFQRLHSRDEFEGTGIGLANVQRIIHRHGGRTWAEGVVDGGATFYFSIPNTANPPGRSHPGNQSMRRQ